jgi:hypothetical protein
MDELRIKTYNQSFGCMLNSRKDQGDRIHESITIHSQTLRQVPDRPAQGSGVHYLRKSEAQAKTGLV